MGTMEVPADALYGASTQRAEASEGLWNAPRGKRTIAHMGESTQGAVYTGWVVARRSVLSLALACVRR